MTHRPMIAPTTSRLLAAACLLATLLWGSLAAGRDLADAEYAELLARIYGGRTGAAAAMLDSLAPDCSGEPYYLIAQARLRLEAIPEDDLDKGRAKQLSQPVLATLQQVIDLCDERLKAGGSEPELRRQRGWAWMVRSQAHAQGGSFYSAGREAGRGKSDLDFYLALHPADPVANGLLGAFLYFTDAVPAIFQMLSKLMFMPTGDRARGLQMIAVAESGQSAKVEDFRTLAMTVNVLFEGRWEDGLPQAMKLHADHPAYVRLALPLAAMRLLAPGLGNELAARIDVTEAISAGLPAADVDTASLWMGRTYRAWIDRLLLGPATAEAGFRAIVAAAPADPDWVTAFAERQLEALAADRADGLPDALAAAVWNTPVEALPALAVSLGKHFDSSVRAVFWAGECRLRLGEIEAAEVLYRKVAESDGADHLEPFRLVACARVGEIKARAGSYRAASRWYERALDHHRGVYRVDWMLKGRARYLDELSRRNGRLAGEPVLFVSPR